MLTDKKRTCHWVKCNLFEIYSVVIRRKRNHPSANHILGKNKNEGKTQMVQQLEVICAMIPVHICHYKPDIQEKTTTKNHQIY